MFSSIKNSQVIVQFALFVAAFVATYAVEKISFRSYKLANSTSKPSVSDESHEKEEKQEKEKHMISSGLKELVKEDGKEEVKFMDSITEPALDGDSNIEDELLQKFLSPSSEQTEFQLPTGEAEDNEMEILCIGEQDAKLEGELIEYQDLQEKGSKESDVTELQNQLKMKAVEIDMLQSTINSLQAQRKKLQEDASEGVAARKELQTAKKKIQELRKQIQLEANETKNQLLLLKQQVSELLAKEEEAFKKDAEVEKKLKALKELEMEAFELKRQNKELLHERRELVLELDSAQARLKTLSKESEMAAKVREEEVNKLNQANEDLVKQVEVLQVNRFSEVEELVYLRWVNACLRHELDNYQSPSGIISARDLNRSTSPRSVEMAKHLMLKYVGSEHGDEETDINSTSAGSEDSENAPPESSTSRISSTSKKGNLMQKLKRWRKSKDDVSQFSSPEGSLSPEPRRRASISHQPSSRLEASSVIREMKNRSSFQLDVKPDVGGRSDVFQSLAGEVRVASFTNIDDLIAFVNRLNVELSFLVDERAVLKQFDWPEAKVEALREAALEYQDLMKLEKKLSSFTDDPSLSCKASIQEMHKLLREVEQHGLLRKPDMAGSRYKEYGIPLNWLLDSGVVGKIKLSSVQLASKCMKRVASELDAMDEQVNESDREFLLMQGVRFASRVHQFAGSFDAESMKAFEDLRSRAYTLYRKK